MKLELNMHKKIFSLSFRTLLPNRKTEISLFITELWPLKVFTTEGNKFQRNKNMPFL